MGMWDTYIITSVYFFIHGDNGSSSSDMWLWLCVSCIFIPQLPCASVIYLSIFLLLALDIFMLLSIFSIKDHIEEKVM